MSIPASQTGPHFRILSIVPALSHAKGHSAEHLILNENILIYKTDIGVVSGQRYILPGIN